MIFLSLILNMKGDRVWWKGDSGKGRDVEPIELALENALPDVLNTNSSDLNFKNVVGKLGNLHFM